MLKYAGGVPTNDDGCKDAKVFGNCRAIDWLDKYNHNEYNENFARCAWRAV